MSKEDICQHNKVFLSKVFPKMTNFSSDLILVVLGLKKISRENKTKSHSYAEF